MSQQGIYVPCYHTQLEKLAANFYHLQGLWLKRCLKMHFLQAECKSSSRSGADPAKGRPNYVMGVWGRRPRGVQRPSPWSGVRSPPEADDIFLFQRLVS